MPAVLAHWAIAKDVAWRFIDHKKPGYESFQGHKDYRHEGISQFFYLGANGPDLPYFYDADIVGKVMSTAGISEYADLFHYNKQGEFVLKLLLRIKPMAENDKKKNVLAYALGHTTHLVADSVVHPYVNWFAGSYQKQSIKDIHKICECHQDSWLAQKYFDRSHIDDGASWTHFLPSCIQVGMPGLPGYTQTDKKTQEVLTEINAAFDETYGQRPGLEYLKDCYENFYDTVVDEGYDKAYSPIPRNPDEALVLHGKVKSKVDYLDLLRTKAVGEAEKACDALIEFYQSGCSESDQNNFRKKVKNWNMDNGYWIDVEFDKDNRKLKIIWRSMWCQIF